MTVFVIQNILRSKYGCVALTITTLLTSCASQDDEYGYVRDVLLRRVGLQIHDSIASLSITDGGSDLHGSMSINYRLTITEGDLESILEQIERDTLHEWITTEAGDYVCIVYPKNRRDTLFGIGVIKPKSIIDINIEQGI